MLALQKDSRHILLLALIRGQLQQELLLFPLCALAVVAAAVVEIMILELTLEEAVAVAVDWAIRTISQ
jgi:hypothetical protein